MLAQNPIPRLNSIVRLSPASVGPTASVGIKVNYAEATGTTVISLSVGFVDLTGASRALSTLTPSDGASVGDMVTPAWINGAHTVTSVIFVENTGRVTVYHRDGRVISSSPPAGAPTTHAINLSEGDFTVTGAGAAPSLPVLTGLTRTSPAIVAPGGLVAFTVNFTPGSGSVTSLTLGLTEPFGTVRTLILLNPASGNPVSTTVDSAWISGQYQVAYVTFVDTAGRVTQASRNGVIAATPPLAGAPTTHTANFAAQDFQVTGTSPPPVISAHPRGQTVVAGDAASFSVSASGAGSMVYQWRKDGVAIPGATASSLTLNNIQPGDAGAYSVVVTNALGSTTSNAATLTVTPPVAPVISSHPQAATVDEGGAVTLAVVATAVPAPTYAWFRDGIAVPGATSATLTLPAATLAQAGSYSVTATNAAGSATSRPALVTVIPLAPPGRIINLSVRTEIAGAGDAFTMGFVVGGAGATGAKPLVLRAAGPALVPLGVPGALADPRLALFTGAARINENDDWGGAPALAAAFTSVGAFPYPGTSSRDAALAESLPPGNHSVQVSGGGTGTVLAELYDASTGAYHPATPRLVNVSLLKHLGSGVTVGFVIGGTTPQTVLLRAVGPTLGAAPFSVPGVVADPQLTLYRGDTAIATNDNWGDTAQLRDTFTHLGAFALALGSRDAALLQSLAPGSYTIVVTGTGGTTGTALVEVYEVP